MSSVKIRPSRSRGTPRHVAQREQREGERNTWPTKFSQFHFGPCGILVRIRVARASLGERHLTDPTAVDALAPAPDRGTAGTRTSARSQSRSTADRLLGEIFVPDVERPRRHNRTRQYALPCPQSDPWRAVVPRRSRTSSSASPIMPPTPESRTRHAIPEPRQQRSREE